MKILVVSPRVYPKNFNPFGNNFFDHTRAIDVINYLPSNNQDKITLSILSSPQISFNFFNKKVKLVQIKRKFNQPNQYLAKLLVKLGMAVPEFYSSLYTFLPQFLADIKQLIDDNDVIYFTTSTAIFPTIYARIKRKYIINDPFGSFFQSSFRNIYSTKIYLIPIWVIKTAIAYIIEYLTFSLSNTVIVFNNIHQIYLKNIFFLKNNRFAILPIKIATSISSNNNQINLYKQKYNIKPSHKILLFIGNFTIPQNSVPLEQVIGLLDNLSGNYRLLVVGPTLPNTTLHPKVIYTGFVTDLENIVPLSSICLAPTQLGSGVKTKILLYLLQNKPVITTIQGANFLPHLDSVYVGELNEQINNNYLNKIIDQKINDGNMFVEKFFSPPAFSKQLGLIYNQLNRIFPPQNNLKGHRNR